MFDMGAFKTKTKIYSKAEDYELKKKMCSFQMPHEINFHERKSK